MHRRSPGSPTDTASIRKCWRSTRWDSRPIRYFAHELIHDSDRAGMVKVGQRADLVLLNANPLDDIRNARDIAGVIVGGRWLSARQLREQTEENVAYFAKLERRAGLLADRARYLKDCRSGSL